MNNECKENTSSFEAKNRDLTLLWLNNTDIKNIYKDIRIHIFKHVKNNHYIINIMIKK